MLRLLFQTMILVLIASNLLSSAFQPRSQTIGIIGASNAAATNSRIPLLLLNAPDGKEKEASLASGSEISSVQDTELGRMARGIARTGMKDLDLLQVGDVVVAKMDVPNLNIWKDFGYEIVDLYAQGENSDNGQVERIPLATLADPLPKSGYTKYLKVSSPKSNQGPVIVTPEEIGLATLKAELQEAMWLAIPGFFWVLVAVSFSNYYTDKYGGNFLNAFFRT